MCTAATLPAAGDGSEISISSKSLPCRPMQNGSSSEEDDGAARELVAPRPLAPDDCRIEMGEMEIVEDPRQDSEGEQLEELELHPRREVQGSMLPPGKKRAQRKLPLAQDEAE